MNNHYYICLLGITFLGQWKTSEASYSIDQVQGSGNMEHVEWGIVIYPFDHVDTFDMEIVVWSELR